MSGLSEVKFGKTGKVPGAGFVLLQRTWPFGVFVWSKKFLVSRSNNHTFTNSLL